MVRNCQVHLNHGVYEKVVGKKAANVRRIPVPQTGFQLQRVRDEGVPTGGPGVVQ